MAAAHADVTPDGAALVDEIDAGLRAAAVPARAESERAYLKSTIEHYGVSVPDTRKVVKAAVRALPEMGHDTVMEAARRLWEVPVHERRLAAVELLDVCRTKLEPNDLPEVERLLREAKTWALVDPLAIGVVGAMVAQHPTLAATLDRWAVDDDFWIRRSAMLALLVPLRQGDGDWDRFARYADQMLDENEFFIRKAIGWVLREMGKRRPDLVFDWVLPRASRASGVTIREAVKPLSEEQRQQVLAARGSHVSGR